MTTPQDPPISPTNESESENRNAERVSNLELFFDLVFVFTVTRLTGLFADDLTVAGLGRTALLLAVIMWMYGGYAWLTNAVIPNSRVRRTLVLVGMGGFLAISLSIPDAFGATGWLFGVGYFVVNAVHSGLFIAAGGAGAARAMLRLAPINLITACLVLAGGFLPGHWRYGLWIAAVVLVVISPYLSSVNQFTISPRHFVERHGLLIIIALGESIVSIGIGAAGLTIDAALVTVAMFGLSLAYLMWWVYFGEGEEETERALAAVDSNRRGRVAIEAFGFANYGLLLGIVVVAAGTKKAVGHAMGHLTLGQALALSGGLAIYLLSDVWFRGLLRMDRLRYRAAGAVLAFATVPLGLVLGGAQLLALILLLMAMLTVEGRVLGSNALGRSSSP